MYILRCADDSYYVGSTTNLERRLWEHNEGIGAQYTARRRPVELAYSAEFPDIVQAYAAEKTSPRLEPGQA
jgi:putative endonuclease